MRILRKPHPLAMFCAWFLLVFLILFPKGGVKFGDLPLTWGYLFIALSSPPLLFIRLLALPLGIYRRVFLVIALLVPMQFLFIYAGYFYGIANPPFAVSTFTGLFALPWIFLLLYPPFLGFIDGERLSRYFRWCIVLAALWGIFLFVWHPLTGHFIEIPYLTVNAEDYGELEHTKHISRGFFFKLISTYNNGNLYGVATLILLPLYTYLEKVRYRRVIVKLAILLTLSRTVWAGLVMLEALPLLVLFAKQVKTFPRVYLASALRRIVAVGVTVGLVFTALLFNANSTLDFLLDPNLGGRSGTFYYLFHTTLLPTQPVYGFSEILYASAAESWGYAGLVAFTLIMVSPLLLLLVDRSALDSPSRRAALKGLVLYIVLAGSDGAFNFIPVMAFYWFTYMIYLFGWPSGLSVSSVRRFRPMSHATHDVLMPQTEGLRYQGTPSGSL